MPAIRSAKSNSARIHVDARNHVESSCVACESLLRAIEAAGDDALAAGNQRSVVSAVRRPGQCGGVQKPASFVRNDGRTQIGYGGPILTVRRYLEIVRTNLIRILARLTVLKRHGVGTVGQ